MSPEKKFRLDESADSLMVSDVTSSSGTIAYEIDVSTITSEGKFSPVIEVQGTPWCLWVKRKENPDSSSSLAVFLYHRKSDSNIWSFDVSAKLSLINIGGGDSITKDFSITFNNAVPNAGWSFIQWDDLVNAGKGFIYDNKILVEAQFSLSNIKGIRTISPFDFADPDEPSHDITFVIDGEKVHANKGILAVHSPVFRAMFYGDFVEKNNTEIELKDIDCKEFIEMLHLIYPSYEKITDANAESVMKLANRFQIKMVLDQAEQFLIDSPKLTVADKLKLSDQYRLVLLQDHCFGTFQTVTDITDLKSTDGYKALSDTAKSALMEKVMKLTRSTVDSDT